MCLTFFIQQPTKVKREKETKKKGFLLSHFKTIKGEREKEREKEREEGFHCLRNSL